MREILQALVQGAGVAVVPLLALTIGLAADPASMRRELGRQPFYRGLFVALVAVPVLAVLVAKLLPIPPLGQTLLVLMAVCPGAPFLMFQARSRQGNVPLALLLAIALSIAAVFMAPLAVIILNRLFGLELQASPGAVLASLAPSLWLPLAIGAGLRARWPQAALRLAPVTDSLFWVSLIILVVPLTTASWPVLQHASVWFWLAMPIVTFGAELLGDLGGRPDPRDRTTVTYAAVLGNPVVALVVARASYPGQHVEAAIVAYVLIRALLLIPYHVIATKRIRRWSPASATMSHGARWRHS